MQSRIAWALPVLLWAASPAWAETVLLRSGGRVEGEILHDRCGEETIVMRTLFGSTVGIPREQVRQVVLPSANEQDYNRRRAQTPDTIQGHLALAQWCKEQHLNDRSKAHLTRVLQLDPDHVLARRMLGYTEREGRWTTAAQRYLADGYVRYRGRWRLPQEVAMLQRRERAKEVLGQWARNVKLWHGWVRDDPERRSDGLAKLRAITDPAALPALNRFLAGDESADVRLLYVDIVAGIPGVAAVKSLVIRSLADAADDVRWAAVERLVERRADEAVPMYVRILHHENNQLVRRAAEALGGFRDARAIEPLIDALVTMHMVRLPENGGAGFGSLQLTGQEVPIDPNTVPTDPMMPIMVPRGTVFSPSSGSPKEIPVWVENQEALFSLTKLTGQNFRFDKIAWKSWWQNYLELSDTKVLKGP